MEDLYSRIQSNLAAIQKRIADAASRAGRLPDAITLVAVTKTVGVPEVHALLQLGVHHFGENRVEVAREKIDNVHGPLTWHMIGTVQRRKAREVAELFDTVDSVDRLELAETLNQRAGETAKILPILVEVNASGEQSKHGFSEDTLEPALKRMNEMRYIRVHGLMTMAPFVPDPETIRPVFARVRKWADRFGLHECSMGMSNDFEVAIEEGATQVRIGTALFQ